MMVEDSRNINPISYTLAFFAKNPSVITKTFLCTGDFKAFWVSNTGHSNIQKGTHHSVVKSADKNR
ncbi:unnamed protein product [Camellia sinensis]